MPQKYYDDFSKLPVDKMAQKIEDMTFLYEQTRVPKKHYKEILSKGIEEMIENSVEMNLIDTYFQTMKKLYDEKPKWFIQALICLQMGVKPSGIKPDEHQALELTWAQNSDKKNLQFVSEKMIENFKDFRDNGFQFTVNKND